MEQNVQYSNYLYQEVSTVNYYLSDHCIVYTAIDDQWYKVIIYRL